MRERSLADTMWDAPGRSQEAPGSSRRALVDPKTPAKRCRGWNLYRQDPLKAKVACRCWASPGSDFCRYHQPPLAAAACANQPIQGREYPQIEAAPQETPVGGDERVGGQQEQGGNR